MDLRALLHHAAGGPRPRARPRHLLADRGPQASRRPAGGVGPRRHALRGPASAGRPASTRRGGRLTTLPGIDPSVPPGGTRCAECEANGGEGGTPAPARGAGATAAGTPRPRPTPAPTRPPPPPRHHRHASLAPPPRGVPRPAPD